MLRIDTVIRNTNLPQVKARLEQAGIQNYVIYEIDSGKSKPSFCAPRSKIEIICKNSQKDAILQAISGEDSGGGFIYVNQITPVITLNNQQD
ncbi:MAG TPA: P-II family nitrogen regulator [Candidatus Nitrosotenuis sp.]|nr:P-II family nitrogen regulator [Candidatus Nitrosotenuis sp.]